MYGRYSGNKRKTYGGRLSGFKRGYARRRSASGWLQPRASRYLFYRFFGNPRADAIINRSASVIPHTYYTKLKFAFQLNWTSTAGVAQYGAFRSAIGDPLGSLGSIRPMGATALDALYTRWCVVGSSCKVTIIQDASGAGANIGSNHCLIPHPNTANPFTAIDVVRAGSATNAKQILVTAATDPAPNRKYLSSYASAAQMFGISNSRVVDDPNFGGSSSTDPSFYFIWIIGAQSSDVSSNTSGQYMVEMVYYVKYWQRNIDPA